MDIPSNGDIIEVAVEGDFDGTEDVINIYQMEATNVTATTITEVLDDIESWVAGLMTVLRPLCNAYVMWRRFRARNLTTATSAITVELDPALAGTATGATMPPGNALLLGFRPGLKRILCKKYVGPPSHTNLDADGTWDATQLILMAALGAFLMPVKGYVKMDVQYGYLRPVYLTFHPFKSYYVSAEGAYQRRRRRGTGT